MAARKKVADSSSATAAPEGIYGTHLCPECGGQIEKPHPGYHDPDAAAREVHCPHCGHEFFPSAKTLAG